MTINCPENWTQRRYRQAVMYISRVVSLDNLSEQIDWEMGDNVPIARGGAWWAKIDEQEHTITLRSTDMMSDPADELPKAVQVSILKGALKFLICWRLGLREINPIPMDIATREMYMQDLPEIKEALRKLFPAFRSAAEQSGVPSAAEANGEAQSGINDSSPEKEFTK